MTRASHDDDPELRALLDSIGLHSTADPHIDSAGRARAERDLQRILDSRGRRRSQHRGWRWATAAVAAIAALILLPLALLHDSPRPSGVTPAVLRFPAPAQVVPQEVAGQGAQHLTVIDRLADRAGQQPFPGPQAPVQEVRAYVWTGTGPVLARWTYLRGDDQVVEEAPVALTKAGLIDDPDTRPLSRTQSTPASSEDPSRFPSERTALLHRLVSAHGCAMPAMACALSELVRLSSTYAIAPDVSSELWHAIARISGLTDLGTTHDRLGRVALGLSTPTGAPGERLIALVDPHTGAIVGSETVQNFDTASPRVTAFIVIRATSRIHALPTP